MPAEPFNRRVEVLVAVVDSPDETALATQLLEGRGWSVRPWTPDTDAGGNREGDDEASAIGSGRLGLLVEVRLYGARFGAVQAALSEIENLARRHQAGMWVVDAVLIEHDLAHDYRTVFHAHRRLPERPHPMARVLAWRTMLGIVTTVRIVKHPGRPGTEALAERLERRTLTRRPYDPEALRLRIPLGMEGRDPESPPPEPVVSTWRLALPLLTGLGVAVACGFAAAVADGLLMLLPLLLACSLVWPVGREITSRREARPLPFQLVWGAAAVGMMTALGALLALTAPGPPAQAALVFAYGALGGTLLALVLYGLGYALVHSWFSRNANWAVPALVPALALSLPWFGGLLHTTYLRSGFGVPSDALQVSVYWSYAASLKPVGLALGLAVVVLAFAGWMRHYHQWVHARGMVRIGVPLMSLFVVVISLAAGLAGADGAAARARATAASGQNPAAYYGVQGRLVCVEPREKRIAVFNGPLATTRPLLTFGASGDRVWLWDPRRGQSLSVRLEDVVVSQARAGTCS
ncbi:hypothetical protein HRW23_24035 [Streptomyces lunaelactis]|uniref:hypothetical protein n=2 Tax=Streptomyces lunaelactis TaxID=1535768 RepID=UPI0015853EDA|nr:hypothetical protein [Streptomyces lunaelactis]NUK03979.1 hypothetical protein [Streptomyces lunaelactis]NUK18485.1 hypothetical protein [Streptomyces lunaelactis]NUK36978.1 hypothetical protein [Streptomyces lunaelactis]NUK44835.1 hypothetical protein [Streptomyces lunaelactis]NUK73067.1 hypothetical protein [Streptomyces lunaelactis]